MNRFLIIGIFVICMLIIVGGTYAIVISYKDQEKTNIINKYESEILNLNGIISNKNNDLSTKNNQINILNQQVQSLNNEIQNNLSVKNEFFGVWHRDSHNGSYQFPSMIIIMANKMVYEGNANENGTFSDTIDYTYIVANNTIRFKPGRGVASYLYEFIDVPTNLQPIFDEAIKLTVKGTGDNAIYYRLIPYFGSDYVPGG